MAKRSASSGQNDGGKGTGGSAKGGQRGTLSSASGQKKRSPTSTPHKGSRVDPSHEVEHTRTERKKKATKGSGKKS